MGKPTPSTSMPSTGTVWFRTPARGHARVDSLPPTSLVDGLSARPRSMSMRPNGLTASMIGCSRSWARTSHDTTGVENSQKAMPRPRLYSGRAVAAPGKGAGWRGARPRSIVWGAAQRAVRPSTYVDGVRESSVLQLGLPSNGPRRRGPPALESRRGSVGSEGGRPEPAGRHRGRETTYIRKRSDRRALPFSRVVGGIDGSRPLPIRESRAQLVSIGALRPLRNRLPISYTLTHATICTCLDPDSLLGVPEPGDRRPGQDDRPAGERSRLDASERSHSDAGRCDRYVRDPAKWLDRVP